MIDIFSVTFLLGVILGLLAGFTIKSYFSKKKWKWGRHRWVFPKFKGSKKSNRRIPDNK